MKRALSLAWTLLAVVSFGQAAEEVGASDSTLVQPKVAVAVEHVVGTGDVIQIHFRAATYDQAAVVKAAEELARATGSTIANWQYFPGPTPDDLSKVMFVVQNVIDPSGGDIRLQPIVRAFMAGSAGTVDSFSIRILGVSPSPYTTLASYNSESVALRGFYDGPTQSIEYRILVKTDDPDKVRIPPRHMPDETQAQPFEEPTPTRAPLLIGLIVLAGASAGALVYFGLLGKRS